MNRNDIITALRNEGVEHAERAVDTVFKVIELSMMTGEPLTVVHHGRYEPKVRAPLRRRNPRTGELITIPSQRTVTFTPSKAFKARLNADR